MIFLELVKIGQKVYEVEVANNFFTRGKGLMFRKEFENNKEYKPIFLQVGTKKNLVEFLTILNNTCFLIKNLLKGKSV